MSNTTAGSASTEVAIATAAAITPKRNTELKDMVIHFLKLEQTPANQARKLRSGLCHDSSPGLPQRHNGAPIFKPLPHDSGRRFRQSGLCRSSPTHPRAG